MALTVVVHGVFTVWQWLYWPVSVLTVLASDRRGRSATIAPGECRLRHIAGSGGTPYDGRGCLSRHSYIQEAFRIPLWSTAVGGSQYSMCQHPLMPAILHAKLTASAPSMKVSAPPPCTHPFTTRFDSPAITHFAPHHILSFPWQ